MRSIIHECTQVVNRHYKINLDEAGVYDTINRTTTNLGWMRGGTKGLRFRNKAISVFGKAHGIETPVNDALLS